MIYVCRDGVDLGEWPEQEFQAKVFRGEILPTDHYFQAGMTDWQLVSGYIPSLAHPKIRVSPPPAPPAVPPAVVVTQRRSFFQKETPGTIGVACVIGAAIGPFISPAWFIVSLALLVAGFVLAIMLIVRGKAGRGIMMLIAVFAAAFFAVVGLFLGPDLKKEAERLRIQGEGRARPSSPSP